MSGLLLKIIAILFMSIDHIGNVFLNNNEIFRFLGRIAFPVFGFLLVEGFIHTKDDKTRFRNYYLRILFLAILTEVFYDKLFFDKYLFINSQNILFTLFTALICMRIYDSNKDNIMHKIESIAIVIYIALIATLLAFDYGIAGILLIFGYYLISQVDVSNLRKKVLYILNTIIYLFIFSFLFEFDYIVLGTFLSLIPICLYNGKRGYDSKIIKYLFYLFYPLHIIIMLLIKTLT